MASLKELITDFLESLEVEKGRSDKTIQNYHFYLRRFFQQSGMKKLSDITPERIRRFRLWLHRSVPGRAHQTIKSNTQNYHLIALRAFLKYCAKRDLACLPAEKIELAKQSERQVSFLEEGERKRLFAAAEKTTGLLGLRDQAILEVLFSTGLRVSELTALTHDHVNLEREEFTVKGKGGKTRLVFLSPTARKKLAAYLRSRTDASPFLFIRLDRAQKRQAAHEPLTPRSIQRLLEFYAKAAGVTKDVSPHTLRHTFATDLLRNGADLRAVQSLLGHRSITTTQIYTHVTDQQLLDIHRKFHARET